MPPTQRVYRRAYFDFVLFGDDYFAPARDRRRVSCRSRSGPRRTGRATLRRAQTRPLSLSLTVRESDSALPLVSVRSTV